MLTKNCVSILFKNQSGILIIFLLFIFSKYLSKTGFQVLLYSSFWIPKKSQYHINCACLIISVSSSFKLLDFIMVM